MSIQNNTEIHDDNDMSSFHQTTPSQFEMMEFLISKVKLFKDVIIKTKEISNTNGSCYSIKVYVNNLETIGNGVFYNAKMSTISHGGRIINIKCVFSDNDILKADMKRNADSLIQCFRDIAPGTIIAVKLETFNEHLSIVASTVRGASLIFVYKRMMDFIRIINEKYGKIPVSTNIPIAPSIQSTPIIEEYIEHHIKHHIEENIVLAPEIPVQQVYVIEPEQNIQTNKIIQDMEEEEKRLLKQLENIRIIIKAQKENLELSKVSTIHTSNTSNTMIIPIQKPIAPIMQPIQKPIAPIQNPMSNMITNLTKVVNCPVNTTSFAYKVKQNLNK